MKTTILAAGAGLGMAAVIAACAPEDKTPTASADFAALCVTCHGPGGKGDGPAASGMQPPPADLTRIAARHGGNFPRDSVMGRINGYTMGSGDSPMPAFGDLLDGREVMYDSGDGRAVPTPARLVALSRYLESIQQ